MTDTPQTAGRLLEIRDLSVTFGGDENAVQAVKRISFDIARGETVALVGESGSGKSVTALSVMQLLPYPLARHPSGSIVFDGREIVGAGHDVMSKIRGGRIGIIFQEPMTSLNPLHTIEKQLAESLALHQGVTGRQARGRII